MTTSSEMIEEIRDRARRIETRVTILSNVLGVEVPTKKPGWQPPNVVIIPTTRASLRDILAVIPKDFIRDVELVCKGELVGFLQMNYKIAMLLDDPAEGV